MDRAIRRRLGAGAGLSRQPGRLIRALLALEMPALVAVATVLAIVFSQFIASAVSLVMTGTILPVVTVAAFIAPALVAPPISFLLVATIGHLRREVDDRQRAEEALRHAIELAESASRTKSWFLANTSHELRTPLNAVIGFSDMIKDGLEAGAPKEKLLEYAGHINDSGRHLLAVLNDILDLSKVEAGKLELYEEEVDVAAIVHSCVAPMRQRADRGNVALVIDVPPGLPMLWADPRKLKQVLLNLLSNAIKFTTPGGRVTTRVSQGPSGAISIAVADTGIGIAAKDIPIALAPFSQVDSAFNRKFEGTGLGLPLAKALVELHQGQFDLQSQPGVGTTIRIGFPAARTRRRAA
jgi:signal transduction histidine kinase